MDIGLQHLQSLDEGITSQIIKDLIAEHEPRANKMREMYARYRAEQLPISERVFKDSSKINNRISNDYRGEIIDTETGYLFGRPIVYQIEEEPYGEELARLLNQRLDVWEMKNNLPDLDNETGKISGICGYGARLVYVDKFGEERVANIDPWECIFIEDQSIGETQYALRHYPVTVKNGDREEQRTRAEFYDSETVSFFIENEDGDFVLDANEPANPQLHLFDYVPLIKFKNNDEELGSFEKVEELIDAYDRLVSDSQNELEEFRQAYMKFIGQGYIDEETVERARQTGAFHWEEGDIGFITKDINDTFLENQKKTLNDNIYKFSQTVDMDDEKFSGSGQSGESRKWKLLALENKAINKERKFTRALQEQFKILCSSWRKKAINLDYVDVKYTFSRNTPIDMLYYADIIQKLKGLVSDETLYSNIPFIEDPQQEISRLEGAFDYITIPEVFESDRQEAEAVEDEASEEQE